MTRAELIYDGKAELKNAKGFNTDQELPSGRWLENMEFSKDFTEVKAIVL